MYDAGININKTMSFKLHIPNPCSEDWNKMPSISNGKHCESCHKDLVDFRGLNNQQIFNSVDVNHKVCGLFSETQLQTEFHIPNQHSFSKVGLAVSFVSLLSFVNPVKAQLPPTQNQTEPNAILTQYNDISKAKSDVKNDTIAIRGKVVDVNTIEPLPFVRIWIKDDKRYHATTDFDGSYVLSIPKVKFDSTVVISVTYLGYQSEEMLITEDIDSITFKLHSREFLGDVIIVKSETKRQKFFNRFRRKKKKKYKYS